MLSLTTDYVSSRGCPLDALRGIAEAGFTHLHWCHHWDDDFLYCPAEVQQIARWLKEFGLGVCDLHASAGQEKGWLSAAQYERQAGIELVANRMEMVARLGTDVIILHLTEEPTEPAAKALFWDRVRSSLDQLQGTTRKCGVRIAIENIREIGKIERVLEMYGADFLGLCYDSGHGNLRSYDGLTWLERVKDRLISVHLHDNDGSADQHRPIFSGTVDWPRLAGVIARSSYSEGVSSEATMKNVDTKDPQEFLRVAYAACTRFAGMVEAERK
jgi:sugar phosphate isomerase/epimerase